MFSYYIPPFSPLLQPALLESACSDAQKSVQFVLLASSMSTDVRGLLSRTAAGDRAYSTSGFTIFFTLHATPVVMLSVISGNRAYLCWHVNKISPYHIGFFQILLGFAVTDLRKFRMDYFTLSCFDCVHLLSLIEHIYRVCG